MRVLTVTSRLRDWHDQRDLQFTRDEAGPIASDERVVSEVLFDESVEGVGIGQQHDRNAVQPPGRDVALLDFRQIADQREEPIEPLSVLLAQLESNDEGLNLTEPPTVQQRYVLSNDASMPEALKPSVYGRA